VSAATSRGTATAPASRTTGRGAPDLLLDAVGDLLSDRTWSAVRMADVAERAGLSRQTVYNSFGTREGLAQAYVAREAAGFLAAVERLIEANEVDPVRALSAALEMFLAAAETHPLVRAISASDDGDELLVLVTTRGGAVLGPLTARLSEVICATWPAVEAADARLAADTLVRLAISHAALPNASPAATAAEVAQILAPFIEQRLGTRGA
jgi:AcrR family transcriptional regulator